ncbi:type II toxin-antitoxin system HicB family antitoxin [Candidatus Micrarchaeota archaeon]|nr:type II toxin-antitoxin system HicB family antitoxin [Candidatus Micrarchaeota archaeon]
MKEIEVEGYRVLVERGEKGKFVITVPDLPGVIGQVEDEKDAYGEIRRLIGRYFVELSKKKPEMACEPIQGKRRQRGIVKK